jgi:NAD(P)-dependent dehydrogenase (short-subunit alcohol dehydrogenase family)
MRGRICVVTGANRGIGKETAIGLARLGATVVMICRDREGGMRAAEEVRQARAGTVVAVVAADLSSQESIRAAAAEILRRWPRLHVLVNNAGVNLPRRVLSADGVETTLAVNHLAPFLLTQLLLPALQAGAPSRVVNVSSELERWGRINFRDLQAARWYNGTLAYLQSKRANILFSYALARRLEGLEVESCCVFPGLVVTGLLSSRWWWRADWLRPIWRLLFLSPAEGARPAILVSSRAEPWPRGMCIVKGGRSVKSSRRSYDVQIQERLWSVSASLTAIAPTR